MAEYSAANCIINNAEAAAYHEQALKARFLDFGERLRHRLLLASLLRSNDYIQAQRRRHELRDFAQTMEEFDVLMTPEPHPKRRAWTRIPSGTAWKSRASPCRGTCHYRLHGFLAESLSPSVQIGGRPFDEPTLFQVAAFSRCQEADQGGRHPCGQRRCFRFKGNLVDGNIVWGPSGFEPA